MISHTFIRRIGIYVQTMEVLKLISGDVFFGLTTLCQLYIYNVYSLFANFSKEPIIVPENDTGIEESLRASFKKIRESLSSISEKGTSFQFSVNFFSEQTTKNVNSSCQSLYEWTS
jgi:hypothetical protein